MFICIKNLIQENYDSGMQILSYRELNKHSGEWLTRFEALDYGRENGLDKHDVWVMLKQYGVFGPEGDSICLSAARKLSKSLL